MRRRLLWFLVGLVTLMVVAVVGGGLLLRHQLRASLPVLDGTFTVSGLTAPVTVERDGLGVPTITAATRADAARALGYLHAQDRFFQMDLQRRQAAGELSALVGIRAIEVDRGTRVHRFRHIAREAVSRATPGISRAPRGVRRRRERWPRVARRRSSRIPRAPCTRRRHGERRHAAHDARDVQYAPGTSGGVRGDVRHDRRHHAAADVRVPDRTRIRMGRAGRRRALRPTRHSRRERLRFDAGSSDVR